MEDNIAQAQIGKDALEATINEMSASLSLLNDLLSQFELAEATLTSTATATDDSGCNLADQLPEDIKAALSPSVLDELSAMTTIAELEQRISALDGKIENTATALTEVQGEYAALEQGIAGMTAALTAQENALLYLEDAAKMMATMMNGSIADMIPEEIKATMPPSVLDELQTVKTIADLEEKISELKGAIQTLENEIAGAETGRTDLMAGIKGIGSAKGNMSDTIYKMTVLKATIPETFTTAEDTYLAEIDSLQNAIESKFQQTLNNGFKQVYATAAIASLLGLLCLIFYKDHKKLTPKNIN